MTSPKKLQKSRGTEQIYLDLGKVIGKEKFKEFLKKHLIKNSDLKKLSKFSDGHTEEQYQGFLRRVVAKITNKVAEGVPKSFKEAIDHVEAEEKATLQSKKEMNPKDDSPAVPNDTLNSSASSATAGQPVVSNNADKSPSSAPGDASVPPAPGDVAVPSNQPIHHQNTGLTQSTAEDSVFSHGNQSSNGSATTMDTNANGNGEVEDTDGTPNDLPPIEELEQEYMEYAENFIKRNFKGLLDPTSPDFKKMMLESARKAKDIMRKYDITPQDAKKLTRLALYDFAILCDDSWSMMADANMEGEDRVTPLKNTLGKISEIATIIEPSGISIRFLNYDDDSTGWDNLVRRDIIEERFTEMEEEWGGITELGLKVDEKIIQPMVIQKMRKGTFKKPLIVVTITDGAPCGEDDNAFREAVIRCKSSKEVASYGEAAVIFIISRVGSDPSAKDFLSGLQKSKELKEWVYCSMRRLDEEAPVMKRAAIAAEAHGDKEYAKNLLNIFLAALDQQTVS